MGLHTKVHSLFVELKIATSDSKIKTSHKLLAACKIESDNFPKNCSMHDHLFTCVKLNDIDCKMNLFCIIELATSASHMR